MIGRDDDEEDDEIVEVEKNTFFVVSDSPSFMLGLNWFGGGGGKGSTLRKDVF